MKESKQHIVKRYVVATAGLFLVALGVALSTRSDLGTSPISCPPYVLSLFGGLSMGQYTVLMHFVFISLQIALLRRRFRAELLLQLVPTFIFGFFTDLAMDATAGLQGETYAARAALLLSGCVVIAAGISVQVNASAWMLAGEQTVAVISEVSGAAFGRVKVFFDSSLVVIGVVLSLCLLHGLEGIREGTIVSALSVGAIVRRLQGPVGSLLVRLKML